jgi:parallel beta-helix repeat protein
MNNEVTRTQGSLSFGIYLDDQANHVQVIKNKISHNAGGMQLHNAYNNLIQENVFYKNKNQQILLNETSAYPLMHDNHIINNNFSSADNVPVYRLWSSLGEKSIRNFGVYKANTYAGAQNKVC